MKMYIIFLLGSWCILQCTGIDECNFVVEINSSLQFIQKLQQVTDVPLQNDCYALMIKEDIWLTINTTINISSSMALYGNGAKVNCIFLSNSFNFSALINVINVTYFEINNITFVGCPSSLRFYDVATVKIHESHFRYVNVTLFGFVCISFGTC